MTLKYMLDTDSVSFALRGHGRVAAAILKRRPSEVCISAITLGELRYGAARRNSVKLHALIDSFTGNISVMPFDEMCAAQFGIVASTLADAGSPIGDYDALIASHAITLNVTLVTNNVRHFGRVEGLSIENWF